MSEIDIIKTWYAGNVIYAEILVSAGTLQLYATVYVSFENEIRIESINSKPPLDDCLACLAYLNSFHERAVELIRDVYRNSH